MKKFKFKVIHQDSSSRARTGIITTVHGDILTPAFVPVGTQATVKSLTPQELQTLGVQLFFVNTYHVYLKPGIDVIKKFEGLHRFMNWSGPLITDSGGFQVFSLGAKRYVNIAISESAVLDRAKFTQKQSRADAAKQQIFPDDYRPVGELVKIDEEGVTFTSHWDGSSHRFTPEVSVDIQHTLGADIIVAFDECPPYPTTEKYARQALDRTHRWAKRSLAFHKKNPNYQALYGVIQGSVYKNLRVESTKFISSIDFDGIAIGGVAVGESKKEMIQVLDWTIKFLPENKPRHLLGVGEVDDIFEIIERGMDTFDCVQPTRLARMGRLYVREHWKRRQKLRGVFDIDITKSEYRFDTKPIDTYCSCYTCQNFTKSYIHHLFRVRELLAYRLATIHNLHFVQTLVVQIRNAIATGTFLEMKKSWLYNT